jgi:hypothetical protein
LPDVSDPTVIGDVAPDADWVVPPLLDVHVAVKPVIVLPPVVPAVKATTPVRLPGVTLVIVGAPGAAAATNDAEAADATLLPIALVASAVQVYVFELVSEPTVIGDVAPDADWVVPPSLDVQVSVKPVIVLPLLAPAVNATLAELLARVTEVTLGAAGVVAATKDEDADDDALSPVALVATTEQV